MDRDIPDRVPFLCQMSFGHMLLQTGYSPAALWLSGELFAEGLLHLRQLYDFDGILISLHGHSPDWEKFIIQENYNIRLINDPGIEELCPYEIKKLQEVWDKYHSKGEWEMVEITHEFPEWRKNDPGDSSKKIPLADILEAVGQLDALGVIEQEAKESVAFDNFFVE